MTLNERSSRTTTRTTVLLKQTLLVALFSYSKLFGLGAFRVSIKHTKVWLVRAKENTKNAIYVRYFLKYEQEKPFT